MGTSVLGLGLGHVDTQELGRRPMTGIGAAAITLQPAEQQILHERYMQQVEMGKLTEDRKELLKIMELKVESLQPPACSCASFASGTGCVIFVSGYWASQSHIDCCHLLELCDADSCVMAVCVLAVRVMAVRVMAVRVMAVCVMAVYDGGG